MFAPLTGGSCNVPQNMSGEVYMMVTRTQSIADAEILAGYVLTLLDDLGQLLTSSLDLPSF